MRFEFSYTDERVGELVSLTLTVPLELVEYVGRAKVDELLDHIQAKVIQSMSLNGSGIMVYRSEHASSVEAFPRRKDGAPYDRESKANEVVDAHGQRFIVGPGYVEPLLD